MPYRIVSLHAHPDDAEILAGGALALLANSGHRVAIATMTSGDCGSAEFGPQEISDMRRAEAAKSAAMIGAEYHCLGFKDLCIFSTDESRRRVTAALRKFQPDIVITASPEDYHCDHEATSRLVIDACFAVSAPNYGTQAFEQAPALPRIPHLYFMDPIGGVDRSLREVKPAFVVDVSSLMDTKSRMLSSHESQRAWLQRQHGMDDFISTMEEWTQSRGRLAGVSHGEGFRQYTGHPYPNAPLLQELLGDYVKSLV